MTAEVAHLPYCVDFVFIGNHTYSTSSASHRRYEGPLVCCGIVHFSCDQAVVPIEATTYVHLFTGGKPSVRRAVTLSVGEHTAEKMHGVAGFWGGWFGFDLNGSAVIKVQRVTEASRIWSLYFLSCAKQPGMVFELWPGEALPGSEWLLVVPALGGFERSSLRRCRTSQLLPLRELCFRSSRI